MNQLIKQCLEREYQRQGLSDQPHSISVNVVVNLEKANLKLSMSIDPEIPFNIFLQGIKEQIFAQRIMVIMQWKQSSTRRWKNSLIIRFYKQLYIICQIETQRWTKKNILLSISGFAIQEN
ncbi:unnamed protein product [Paramecium primaurelia]|uniref:Uncharacterized protein n=1 Tax=Paramecium primaurelia TaxID=5886 RepID=A0A8S1JPJ0_PARPR|nr:unnamed protein product [Paramecium primaurelia]